jgi:uncharacterized protein (TIGR03435 family)
MQAHLKLALALVAALTVQPTLAQTSAAITPQIESVVKPILFETISVRKNNTNFLVFGFTADGFDADGESPAALIVMAYQFKDLDRIRGLQPWCFAERYAIRAKVADTEVAAWQKLSPAAKGLALRALLEERFHLKLHRETKEGHVYELVVARGGPKLKESKPVVEDPDAPAQQQSGVGFHAESMDQFASTVSMLGVSRPVVNKTGLTALYDIDLKQPSEADSSESTPGSPDSLIIHELQDQLGLNLKSATGPVETLVIDYIERPSQN